ncbi:MAG: hypothetical protein IPK10_11275 [Bacteroidetes bacterium]|nr:hypothetical protein [Bacteroidota bacterium]
MKNFLQNKFNLIQAAIFISLIGFNSMQVIAQEVVIGNVFSITSDPELENELLSFEAKSYSESIECKWIGNFSESIQKFEVQRSTKVSEFVTIATVDVNSFCGKKNTFCFEDKNLQEHTKYFYRLKFNSADGLTSYSTIISAKVNSNSIVIAEATPNPYKDRTTIQYMLSNPSLVTVEIANEGGVVVKRFQQGLQKEGRYTVPFSAKEEGLPAGRYVVTVWFDDDNYQLSITETE